MMWGTSSWPPARASSLRSGGGRIYQGVFQEDTRYRILCNRSGGHSVPVVDGQEQKAGPDYRGLMSWQNGVLSIEMAGAYDVPELSSLRRQFTFGEDRISLQDNFSFQGTALPVIERFITQTCPRRKGGRRIGKALLDCGELGAGCHGRGVGQPYRRAVETVYLIDFIAKNQMMNFV